MPDFDVAAAGLASPPSEAFKTAYRPAVSVKNNGRHPADVVGNIAVINRATGLQAFSAPVSLAALAPGATGAAQSTASWTPEEEGYYLAFGYVTTDHDSIPANNILNPVQFHVGPGTPPPPVVVPAHAAQHEEAGSDKVDVEGLVGKLADPQDPEDHAAKHQLGGEDQLSLAGLSGKAAEAQTPITHSNAYHNPQMATESELTSHQGASAVHSAATNLANRDTTGGETGLVTFLQLAHGSKVQPQGDRYLRGDRWFHAPVPDGLICLWNGTNPIPTDWAPVTIAPVPTAPYIQIQKLPTTP